MVPPRQGFRGFCLPWCKLSLLIIVVSYFTLMGNIRNDAINTLSASKVHHAMLRTSSPLIYQQNQPMIISCLVHIMIKILYIIEKARPDCQVLDIVQHQYLFSIIYNSHLIYTCLYGISPCLAAMGGMIATSPGLPITQAIKTKDTHTLGLLQGFRKHLGMANIRRKIASYIYIYIYIYIDIAYRSFKVHIIC